MASAKQSAWALKFASEDLWGYMEIVMAAVNHNECVLKDASEDLQKDREILMAAVQQYGCALEFSSLELWGDCDVVLEAAEHNSSSLQYANLTRLARDNTTSPANFGKILSCFDSITSIFTLIGEKPNFVRNGLLQ